MKLEGNITVATNTFDTKIKGLLQKRSHRLMSSVTKKESCPKAKTMQGGGPILEDKSGELEIQTATIKTS